MNTTSMSFACFTLLLLGLCASSAQAASKRTYVSGSGADAAPCSLAAPCATLDFAAKQTVAGGEIDVLDSGDYGPLTIRRAVSIVNDGAGVAGITVTSGNGVTVQAGPSDAVYLRGLTIHGTVKAANGIEFDSGGSLQIVDCDVRDFTQITDTGNFGIGIRLEPTTNSSILIAHTNTSNNGNYGILIRPLGSATTHSVISRSTVNKNLVYGIAVSDGGANAGIPLRVDIVDSVIASSASGIYGNLHSTVEIAVRNSDISGNGKGVESGGATFRISHSTLHANTNGYFISAGTSFTYGDNVIDGNSGNSGSLTSASLR